MTGGGGPGAYVPCVCGLGSPCAMCRFSSSGLGARRDLWSCAYSGVVRAAADRPVYCPDYAPMPGGGPEQSNPWRLPFDEA